MIESGCPPRAGYIPSHYFKCALMLSVKLVCRFLLCLFLVLAVLPFFYAAVCTLNIAVHDKCHRSQFRMQKKNILKNKHEDGGLFDVL